MNLQTALARSAHSAKQNAHNLKGYSIYENDEFDFVDKMTASSSYSEFWMDWGLRSPV